MIGASKLGERVQSTSQFQVTRQSFGSWGVEGILDGHQKRSKRLERFKVEESELDTMRPLPGKVFWTYV